MFSSVLICAAIALARLENAHSSEFQTKKDFKNISAEKTLPATSKSQFETREQQEIKKRLTIARTERAHRTCSRKPITPNRLADMLVRPAFAPRATCGSCPAARIGCIQYAPTGREYTVVARRSPPGISAENHTANSSSGPYSSQVRSPQWHSNM
jgi:hypothetical protein